MRVMVLLGSQVMQQGYAQSISSMVKRATLPRIQATTLPFFQMPASLVLSMQEELCQDMNDGTEGHLLQGRQSLKTQGLTLISVTARPQPSVRPPVPPALRPVLVSMAWTCSALPLHWRKSKLQTRPARLMMLTPVDVWLAFCAAWTGMMKAHRSGTQLFAMQEFSAALQ